MTHEPRWPGLVALIAAAGLQALLPERLSAGPGWMVVVVVAVLAIVKLLVKTRTHHFREILGYVINSLTTAALCYSLAGLIRGVASKDRSSELLLSAGVVWSMNILVFASWYWRLDGGGIHKRSQRGAYSEGAFLFPQPTLRDAARSWRPRFIDYLFLAFNTSTAFSPTDVPVLSRWAKVLMMVQSSISLATLAVVAARAVNLA